MNFAALSIAIVEISYNIVIISDQPSLSPIEGITVMEATLGTVTGAIMGGKRGGTYHLKIFEYQSSLSFTVTNVTLRPSQHHSPIQFPITTFINLILK